MLDGSAKVQNSRQQVREIIRFELTRPPAAAGRRLINERQLARLLDTNRMNVRRSLADLEAQGLVIRRHGSGTYLRKVPIHAMCLQGYRPLDTSIFVADEETGDRPSRLRPDPAKQQLSLGVWSDMHCTSLENKLLLEGISQHVSELSHHLHMYSMAYASDGATRRDDIVEELEASPCDGFIVSVALVQPFLEAYRQVWGAAPPPLVQVWSGSILPTYEPLIHTDTQQAIERATRVLIEQGYRRIALLDQTSPRESAPRGRLGYQLAMEAARLATHLVTCREILSEGTESPYRQWEPVLAKLLDTEPRPEALVLAVQSVLKPLQVVMRERSLKPGRDLGIVTIANEGIALPAGEAWSAMMFDPRLVGTLAVNSLVNVIGTAGQKLCSFSHQARWRAGTSHLRKVD